MIKVCIPYYSEHEQTRSGVRELQESGIPCEIVHAQGALVAQARNALVNGQSSQAIYQDVGGKYSHFLFVDSDIGFSLKHLKALLAHDVDIICAPYLRHGRTDQYQSGTFLEPGIIGSRYAPESKGLKEVDWCGAGFLLVKAAAFSRIRYPWFRYGIIEKNGMAEILGEDFGFCMSARDAGFKIWCDFDFPVFHKERQLDYQH